MENIFPAKDLGICPASAARDLAASESLCSKGIGGGGAPRAIRKSSAVFLASSDTAELTGVDEVEKKDEEFAEEDDDEMPFFRAASRSEML